MLVGIVMISLIAPSFFLAAAPKQVHAQVGMITCLASVLGYTSESVLFSAGGAALGAAGLTVPITTFLDGNTTNINLNSGSIAGSTGSLTWKECIVDSLMWMLKEVVISSLTGSVIEWINSGFEGWPTFITDPKGFFTDLADIIAGEFITAGGLEFLCSPFQLDIQIALILKYFTPDRGADGILSCRFTDIVNNVEDFLSGSFEDGGWPAFFNVALTMQNSAQGSFFYSDAAVKARIYSAQGQISQELEWGKGFLSIKCDVDDDPATPDEICTPGTWIENQLNDYTNSSLERLEVADEIDEVLGALLQYLVREIMTGAKGLLGQSMQNVSNGNVSDSYTSQLQNYASTAISPQLKKDELVARINALIATENAIPRDIFIPFLEELLVRVNSVDLTNSSFALSEFRDIESDLIELERVIQAGLVPGPHTIPGSTPPSPFGPPQ